MDATVNPATMYNPSDLLAITPAVARVAEMFKKDGNAMLTRMAYFTAIVGLRSDPECLPLSTDELKEVTAGKPKDSPEGTLPPFAQALLAKGYTEGVARKEHSLLKGLISAAQHGWKPGDDVGYDVAAADAAKWEKARKDADKADKIKIARNVLLAEKINDLPPGADVEMIQQARDTADAEYLAKVAKAEHESKYQKASKLATEVACTLCPDAALSDADSFVQWFASVADYATMCEVSKTLAQAIKAEDDRRKATEKQAKAKAKAAVAEVAPVAEVATA